MATTLWNSGLPSGWEAKWDPVQNKPFFVNHALKSTTWEDPRFSKVEDANRPQTAALATADTSSAASKAKSQANGKSQPAAKTTAKPPPAAAAAGASTAAAHGVGPASAEAGDLQYDEQALEQLRSSYPAVPADVLLQVWNSCQHDATVAGDSLRHMGYQNRAEHMMEQTQKAEEERLKEASTAATATATAAAAASAPQDKQKAATSNAASDASYRASTATSRDPRAPVPPTEHRRAVAAGALPSGTRAVTTAAATASAIASAHATVARGPDPSLCRGPDASLIGKTKGLARGADPALAVGPRPQRS